MAAGHREPAVAAGPVDVVGEEACRRECSPSARTDTHVVVVGRRGAGAVGALDGRACVVGEVCVASREVGADACLVEGPLQEEGVEELDWAQGWRRGASCACESGRAAGSLAGDRHEDEG